MRAKLLPVPLGAILLTMIGAVMTGCALIAPLPEPASLTQRLATIPTDGLDLKGPVTIHWDDHQIPFIEAAHDSDAAFALGLVHAHLRLGQMAVFRHIAQGRIAEMGGPLATDIDHGLRILNFGRAAADIEAALPDHTRDWIGAFVAGINHYQANAKSLPAEFGVLGLTPEEWTIGDVISIGRVAGSDVNWLIWAGVLPLRPRADWPELWAKLVKHGSASIPSFSPKRDVAMWNHLIAGGSRSGSNSLAIAPSRSKTGAAIMANDPHLGITLPNIWLIAGVKSPSYHVVGLMAPGLPVFGIGRNPWAAWGGTNMRAASSDLVDISNLDPSRVETRRETIKTRWWFDREIEIRETEWGPVISDAPLFADADAPPFALRWTGHRVSDEISALLAASKARDFDAFRAAFDDWAVPGENMLYADATGTIGQVMAVQLPARGNGPPRDVLTGPAKSQRDWGRIATASTLPYSRDPAKGYLVSANNRPAKAEIAIGHFFSPNDRIGRMNDLMRFHGKVGIDELGALQRDVYLASAVALRDLLIEKLDQAKEMVAKTEGADALVRLMRDWDGHYRASARAPVAFEAFRARFTEKLYAQTADEELGQTLNRMGRAGGLLHEEIIAAPKAALDAALKDGLIAAREALGEHANWGEMHRLTLAHPLSFLPIIGGRYRFADLPTGGSTETLMKTAHGPAEERHDTRYGSNARHISDLSDIDANYFALLGGQDGWFNSANFLDQLPLWRKGDYVKVPLRLSSVRAAFPHKTMLSPAR